MAITSGYNKYKRYEKLSDGTYKLVSLYTSSNTVHFDDGKTAQTKVGAISGITDSLTATSSNVALSAKAGNSLQTQIDDVNSNLGNISRFSVKTIAFDASNITIPHGNNSYYITINLKENEYPIGIIQIAGIHSGCVINNFYVTNNNIIIHVKNINDIDITLETIYVTYIF